MVAKTLPYFDPNFVDFQPVESPGPNVCQNWFCCLPTSCQGVKTSIFLRFFTILGPKHKFSLGFLKVWPDWGWTKVNFAHIGNRSILE